MNQQALHVVLVSYEKIIQDLTKFKILNK